MLDACDDGLMMARSEQDPFAGSDRSSGADALIESELEVLGSDYQASGYTTRSQADELGRHLRIRAGQRLLDIGSGCGWPGLYLASRLSCHVVVVDPIIDGVLVARHRADHDGMVERQSGLQGQGSDLPFAPRSFDAVVHTDVTC